MNGQNLKRVHRLTALIILVATLFYLFFQVNKGSETIK